MRPLWKAVLWIVGVGTLVAFYLPEMPGRPYTAVALLVLWLVLVSVLASGVVGRLVRTAAITTVTLAIIIGVVAGLASLTGRQSTPSGSGGHDATGGNAMLATVDRLMDSCWREVIAAAPEVEAIDHASPETIDAVTRITLVICMERESPAGFTCNAQGCFDAAGSGRNWNTVIEDWFIRCWGQPTNTRGCLP